MRIGASRRAGATPVGAGRHAGAESAGAGGRAGAMPAGAAIAGAGRRNAGKASAGAVPAYARFAGEIFDADDTDGGVDGAVGIRFGFSQNAVTLPSFTSRRLWAM